MSSSPDCQRGPDELEIAQPLRPAAARPAAASDASAGTEPAAAEPAASAVRRPEVAFSGRPSSGPSKLRVGVVSGAAVALAVGAVATSFAATPTPRATTTQPGAAAISLLPAILDPAVDPAVDGEDLGRFGGPRGFREITVSAISGSNVTLTTDDGWTRTIAITDDVELTKGGQDIEVSGLAVGDQVRFAQTRNDDGTYTVTAVAVVVPHVSGTVSELTDTGFKVTTRDGSVWTITTDGSTTYQYGAADGTRADLENGAVVLVQGESTGDNALRALGVRVAADRVMGTVTAKTADTITVTKGDGTTVTVHVSAETEYRVPGAGDDADLGNVTVDMGIAVQGRTRDDGSIDASVVTAGTGRGFGHGEFGVGDGWGGPGRHGGDGPNDDDDGTATPTPSPTAAP